MLKISRDIPVEHLLSRQMQFWEIRQQDRKKHKVEQAIPCITISREIGSRGIELAKCLGERLGWQIFDREIVDYIANNAHVRREMVEMFDSKTKNELNNWILTILDRHALSSDRYFQHLVAAMASIAQHGRGIILGRGGNFILPANKALKVRVVAPLKDRIRFVAKVEKIGEDEAVSLIKRTEHEREAFFKKFFHDVPKNPLNYDLVLNLEKLGLVAAEETTVTAFSKKFGLSEGSLKN